MSKYTFRLGWFARLNGRTNEQYDKDIQTYLHNIHDI